jgi:two-component system, NarL family, sensor histidine kinase DesK
MRLLPKDQDWTPYAYLIYLPIFVAAPFLAPTPLWQREAVVAATLVFFPLYFWGYWLRGPKALVVIGAFALMGSVFAPINPGASVFFVYGASFLGKAFETATAYRMLAAMLALIALESWVFQLSPYFSIPALVFAALIGSVIIQQMRGKRLNQALVMAQDEVAHMAQIAERERIARDLHDLLGHTFSVIVLKSELASRLSATDPARAADEIRDVERIARDALAQVRAAVRGYRSAGIASELKSARETLETAGIQVETQVETQIDAPPLSPAQEGVIALALREAVTNVVRHAQATFCRLTLRRNGPYCELEIQDNGRGGTAEEGSGLIGMRQRVETLGGALERDGSHGTLLRIRVPV